VRVWCGLTGGRNRSARDAEVENQRLSCDIRSTIPESKNTSVSSIIQRTRGGFTRAAIDVILKISLGRAASVGGTRRR
jgi:hypothetical protein